MKEVREVIQAQIDRLQAALDALDGNVPATRPTGVFNKAGVQYYVPADIIKMGNGKVHRRRGGHMQKCKGCTKNFIKYDPRQLFHSKKCVSAYHTKNRDNGIKKCAWDNEPFKARSKGQKYCSKSHAMKHRVLLDKEYSNSTKK